jgi:hypothetical protein
MCERVRAWAETKPPPKGKLPSPVAAARLQLCRGSPRPGWASSGQLEHPHVRAASAELTQALFPLLPMLANSDVPEGP